MVVTEPSRFSVVHLAATQALVARCVLAHPTHVPVIEDCELRVCINKRDQGSIDGGRTSVQGGFAKILRQHRDSESKHQLYMNL